MNRIISYIFSMALTFSLIQMFPLEIFAQKTQLPKEKIQPKQKIQIKYFCKSESFTMDSIILIAVNPKKSLSHAKEILQAKELMWTGIQKNDSVLLDSLFSKNFVYPSKGQFRERKEHIIYLTKKDWTLLNVRAWDICLEFVGDIAILTYQNTGTSREADKSVNEFTLTGVDVWIKEMGKWKISTHRPL